MNINSLCIIKGRKDPEGESKDGTFFFNIITSRIWIYLTKWISLNIVPSETPPLVFSNLNYYKRTDEYPRFKIDVTNTSVETISFSATQLLLFPESLSLPILHISFVDSNISEISLDPSTTVTLDLQVEYDAEGGSNLYGSSLVISELKAPFRKLAISDPFVY